MSHPSFDLRGRAALITGSTYGLGWGLARALARAGCDVMLNGRRPDPVPPLLAELRGYDVAAEFVAGDMSQPADNAAVVAATFARFPQVDILVCNAGSFFDTDFLEMTAARFDQTFALNVRGQFLTTQAFVQACRQRDEQGGRVILMASANALQSEGGSVAYDASKGAIAAMTRALAIDLGPLGFTVNALAPGLIDTPLTSWLAQRPAARAHYEQAAPLRRIGQIDEVGEAAVYLAGAAGRYVTGQLLVIDGGLTAQQIPPAPEG
ncbi:MAG: SDR family oxidoreductase [Fimbriimonadaceae bacterium]|nr:SDR family oxidoreductase [Fimbriimonadaceae bacterium]